MVEHKKVGKFVEDKFIAVTYGNRLLEKRALGMCMQEVIDGLDLENYSKFKEEEEVNLRKVAYISFNR